MSGERRPPPPDVLAGALHDPVHRDLADLTKGELWNRICELTRDRDQWREKHHAMRDLAVASQAASEAFRRERDEARRLLAEWLAGPMSDESHDAGLGKRTRAALAEFDGEPWEHHDPSLRSRQYGCVHVETLAAEIADRGGIAKVTTRERARLLDPEIEDGGSMTRHGRLRLSRLAEVEAEIATIQKARTEAMPASDPGLDALGARVREAVGEDAFAAAEREVSDSATVRGCSGCGVGLAPHGPDCRAGKREPIDEPASTIQGPALDAAERRARRKAGRS